MMTDKEALVMVTVECRDLLEVVQAEGDRNQIIRDHFKNDMSGYGIGVEEYLSEGMSEEDRERIVNEVLARPEYNSWPPK